jgi:adenylate kinase family enzyme
MMEEAEKGKKKGVEPNRDDMHPRLEDKWVYKLMQEKLLENACRNRGYILDGFPRAYKDA